MEDFRWMGIYLAIGIMALAIILLSGQVHELKEAVFSHEGPFDLMN